MNQQFYQKFHLTKNSQRILFEMTCTIIYKWKKNEIELCLLFYFNEDERTGVVKIRLSVENQEVLVFTK